MNLNPSTSCAKKLGTGDNAVSFAVILVIVAVALLLTVWVTMSHFEAAAYNRLTGGSVTTWDAMWIQLRVMGAE